MTAVSFRQLFLRSEQRRYERSGHFLGYAAREPARGASYYSGDRIERAVERAEKGALDKRRYLPLQDDIASVAYWCQTLPAGPFPAAPNRDDLEII